MEDKDLNCINDITCEVTEVINPDQQKKAAQKVAQSNFEGRGRRYPRRPSSDSEDEKKRCKTNRIKENDVKLRNSPPKKRTKSPKKKINKSRRSRSSSNSKEEIKGKGRRKRNYENSSSSDSRNKHIKDDDDEEESDEERKRVKSPRPNKKRNCMKDDDDSSRDKYQKKSPRRRPRYKNSKDNSSEYERSKTNRKKKDDDSYHNKVNKSKASEKYYCLFEKKNDGVPYKYSELFKKLIKYHLPSPSDIEYCIVIPYKELTNFEKKEKLFSFCCKCSSKEMCTIHKTFQNYFPIKSPANDSDFCCLLLTIPVLSQEQKNISKALSKFFSAEIRHISASLQLQIHPLLISAFCNEEIQVEGIRAKVSDLPVVLTTDGDKLNIEYFWDKQIEFERMILEKKEREDLFQPFSVTITTGDDQFSLIKELITDKDDIALEMSVKEYKDLVKFMDFPTGEIKFETKVFLKTTIEDKIRSLIKSIILTKFSVVSECEWLWSPAIEQLFIRNSRYAHNIFRAEDPDFNVVFRAKSQSVFIYTLNKDKMSMLGSVKTELIKTFREIFKNKIEIQYMFPLKLVDFYKPMISSLNCEESQPEEKYPEEIKNKCESSCVLINDEKITKIIKSRYQLYEYVFLFKTSAEKKAFNKDLEACKYTEIKNGNKNKFMLEDCRIFEYTLKFKNNDDIYEEKYSEFMDYIKQNKSKIKKKYNLIYFKCQNNEIKLKSLAESKKCFNKKSNEDKYCLAMQINNFNQNNIASK